MARTSVTKNIRLMKGRRQEIVYKMRTAYEYLYHSSVEPRGGLLVGSDKCPFSKSSTSKGTARDDRNVKQEKDPESNIGIRVWPVSEQEEQHPIYNEPVNDGEQFNDPPYQTFGVVKYSDEGNRDQEIDEFGAKISRRAQLIIPFWHHYQNDLPEPLKGDLVEFWADNQNTFGIFYNIQEVNEGHYIGGTNYFTEWVLQITRNDEFVPERRLLGNR